MSKSAPLPLIALVNSKSGGQDGPKLIQKLQEHIPKENVFDLTEGGPAVALAKCQNQRVRVLVCGGDGTVAWVLSEIKKLHLEERLRPVVAILPLGTANDLSRTLRWGPGWAGEKLHPVFPRIEQASVVHMDQWHVTTATEAGVQERVVVMNNYFSVGSDAEVALKFHKKREEKPSLFKNRARNKGWYAKFAVSSFLHAPSLASGIEAEVDGVKLELPKALSVLLILNLPSYASGMNPWGDPRKKSKKPNSTPPAIDDGKFEVVGIKGLLHAGGLQFGVAKGKRLAQGSSLVLKLKRPIAAQVDGEPWLQEPATITISHGGHAMMLANSPPTVKPEEQVQRSPQQQPSSPTPSSPPTHSISVASLALELGSSGNQPTRPAARSGSFNTISRINYGPVPVAKRKKNRYYCNDCSLEFFLPYMLENHVAKGCVALSSSSSSSSSKSVLQSTSSAPTSSSTPLSQPSTSSALLKPATSPSLEVPTHSTILATDDILVVDSPTDDSRKEDSPTADSPKEATATSDSPKDEASPTTSSDDGASIKPEDVATIETLPVTEETSLPSTTTEQDNSHKDDEASSDKASPRALEKVNVVVAVGKDSSVDDADGVNEDSVVVNTNGESKDGADDSEVIVNIVSANEEKAKEDVKEVEKEEVAVEESKKVDAVVEVKSEDATIEEIKTEKAVESSVDAPKDSEVVEEKKEEAKEKEEDKDEEKEEEKGVVPVTPREGEDNSRRSVKVIGSLRSESSQQRNSLGPGVVVLQKSESRNSLSGSTGSGLQKTESQRNSTGSDVWPVFQQRMRTAV